MVDLTPPQLTLQRILEAHADGGMPPPTVREVCAEMGYRSTRAASDVLDALERKGYIQRVENKARAIRLVRRLPQGIPVMGSIAAGLPRASEVDEGDRLIINPEVFGIPFSHSAFALKVCGDSMIGRHLFDGDIVVCDATVSPVSGDVVVALIDQQSTLKTLMKERNKVWLKAENPAYSELYPASSLTIQGVARGVLRSLAT